MDKKRSFGVRAMELFLRLHARLPLAYHYAWGRFITWLVRDVFRYRNDVVLTNIARSFPDEDYDFIKVVYRQFYVHFGELFAEAVWFSGCRGERGRKRLLKQRICEIENIDEFNAFYDRSSSVMLLNSHAGNWELMGGVGQYDTLAPGKRTWTDKEVVVLYRALSSKFWDQVMADGRCAPVSDLDFEGYVEGSSILRYAISHRKEKKLYIFNTDQYPYWQSGRFSVGGFMHQETLAMGGGAAIACKMGMSVAYIRWYRTERGHYRLTFVPLLENASESTPEDIMKLYYKHLEEDIQAQPWNYLWTHKRWRKQ
ncbi:MAG: lysophospholipid acyltransferase family protein [Bacteroidales bacterium]|nr:lysophospholipid acyltransferase family protein [Bacteroidales bacterium]